MALADKARKAAAAENHAAGDEAANASPEVAAEGAAVDADTEEEQKPARQKKAKKTDDLNKLCRGTTAGECKFSLRARKEKENMRNPRQISLNRIKQTQTASDDAAQISLAVTAQAHSRAAAARCSAVRADTGTRYTVVY